MTTLMDMKGITFTPNAKTLAQTKGVDLAGLHVQAQLHAQELQTILKQIVAFHPSGGGDAANLTALNNIITAIL